MDERVLVWAPARDGRLTCSFLTEVGFSCVNCESWEAFRAELQEGVGAVVIAGEYLSESVLANLEAIIDAQPPWSDLPVIIVAGTELAGDQDRFRRLGNVSPVQRPVSVDTLRSTVRAALRGRGRQYEIRDLLRQRDEADKRKDEFLAMLAHELRNPLAPLRTGLELLKLEPSPELVERTKATMERQITNLTRLVDDLLDVSRVTRGKVALKKISLDARQPVSEAVSIARPLAISKGLTLDVRLPDQPVMVHADPVRVEQIIGNLIGNAIKFTSAGGSVRVSLDVNDGWAVMRVRDTGVGIPPGHLHRVFDLFGQVTSSLDRSQGGLGIGLTVVRLIAELHGGKAQVFSEGVGRGTEAVVHLPVQTQTVSSDTTSTQHAAPRTSAKRVLLVEDNPDVAEMLAAYLQQLGHDVMQAHDGRAGLDAAMRYRPEVIVCDIGLPGLDGYEIARRVRERPDLQSSVLIAVSGYGDSTDRERARTAGFDHHLTKPADPVQLADLIDQTSGGSDR
jgi:signal transduction histidine kinase/ActR/RegA family two-component response regulator